MAGERRVKAERAKRRGTGTYIVFMISLTGLGTKATCRGLRMYYIGQLDIDFIAILRRYSFITDYAQICVIQFTNATWKTHKLLCSIYHIHKPFTFLFQKQSLVRKK